MATPSSPTPLVKRIEASLAEGRLAQALELAKQNALQTPGEVSQALLRRCYLKVAEYHVYRDAFRDAHVVLSEAEKLPFTDPTWWLRLAELRAETGDHKRAMDLVGKVDDPKAKATVLGRVADRTMREHGNAGKAMLPTELHPQLDLIQKAFAEHDKGRDEQARELLNGIGLTSPFLEWKVMLRGLMAWSTNDDAKAAENWDRLNPDRLPARLVAPLRLNTERDFAKRLSPDRLPIVQKQAETLNTGGLSDSLRRMRQQLATEEMLPQALETARVAFNDIKKVAPHVIPKLANIFYWAIVNGGQPEDLAHYTKLFGPHPDDPNNFRLQALIMETIGDTHKAHVWWAKYEQWIQQTPERWPGSQTGYARAMILERMGNLAKDWLEMEDEPDNFLDFFGMPQMGRNAKTGEKIPLKPSAIECYQKANQLAPTWQTPALRLLEEYIKENKPQSLATTEQLVAQFPKDLPILEAAARLYDGLGKIEQSRACLKQALAINPLDRRLQQRVATVAVNHARRQAIAGEHTEALATLAEAKQFGDAGMQSALLALNYALNNLMKQPEAAQSFHDELFRLPGMRIAGAYRIMVEMSRLKCPKKNYTSFSNAFNDGLKTPATEDEMAALLVALDYYRQEPTPYYGMKTHDKKIMDFFTRTVRTCDKVDEMIRYGFLLYRFKMYRLLQELAVAGHRRAPNDPHFTFFRVEANLLRQREPYVSWQMGRQYVEVLNQIMEARDGRYDRLKELFERRQKETPEIDEAMNPPRFPWGF